jgi:uncharacterized protein
MRLNEVQYQDGKPIDGYGPGFFRIGGEVFEGPVLTLCVGTLAWGGLANTQSILAHQDAIDVVFVGTGAEITHLPEDFRDTLEAAGLGVEVMAAPAACRTYNVLLSEGRRIAAALIPVT